MHFITSNNHKFEEIKHIMPHIMQLEIDLPEIQDFDPHVIIKHKLKSAFDHHAGPFIVEDTSLWIDGLNGLPGPFIKWFLKSLGVEGIYRVAAGSGNVTAKGMSVIGYAESKDTMRFFEGSVAGKIVEPKGNYGFGWDAAFQPNGFDKTVGEMNTEERKQISWRSIAARQLQEYLTN